MRAAAVGINVPVPEVVQRHAPVVEVPLTETELLFAQTVLSAPAVTAGGAVKTMVTVSSSELQLPLVVEVRISSMLPDAISAALGTNVPVSAVAAGVKEPVAVVVHIPVPVVEEPLSLAFALLEHTEIVAPAFTLGALVIVTVI